MQNYMAEMVGTALLVLLGNGAVANVVLARSKGQQSGWIVITTGWGLAVAMAVYAVGRVSGAHINPAVTVSLASIGAFPWNLVPGYIISQLVGGFAGAVAVWLVYLPHWEATADTAAKLGCFSTIPEIRRPSANLLTEAIATFVLVLGILAIADNAQTLNAPGELDLSRVFSQGLQPLLVGFLVWSIGLSLGGPTGYAINPARDLGPRIAHFLLPVPGKGSSDWTYSWIPVMGPLLGGLAGAQVYRWLEF